LPRLTQSGLVQLGPGDAAELAEAGQPSIAGRVEVLTGERLAGSGGLEAGCGMAADLVS